MAVDVHEYEVAELMGLIYREELKRHGIDLENIDEDQHEALVERYMVEEHGADMEFLTDLITRLIPTIATGESNFGEGKEISVGFAEYLDSGVEGKVNIRMICREVFKVGEKEVEA